MTSTIGRRTRTVTPAAVFLGAFVGAFAAVLIVVLALRDTASPTPGPDWVDPFACRVEGSSVSWEGVVTNHGDHRTHITVTIAPVDHQGNVATDPKTLMTSAQDLDAGQSGPVGGGPRDYARFDGGRGPAGCRVAVAAS